MDSATEWFLVNPSCNINAISALHVSQNRTDSATRSHPCWQRSVRIVDENSMARALPTQAWRAVVVKTSEKSICSCSRKKVSRVERYNTERWNAMATNFVI